MLPNTMRRVSQLSEETIGMSETETLNAVNSREDRINMFIHAWL